MKRKKEEEKYKAWEANYANLENRGFDPDWSFFNVFSVDMESIQETYAEIQLCASKTQEILNMSDSFLGLGFRFQKAQATLQEAQATLESDPEKKKTWLRYRNYCKFMMEKFAHQVKLYISSPREDSVNVLQMIVEYKNNILNWHEHLFDRLSLVFLPLFLAPNH